MQEYVREWGDQGDRLDLSDVPVNVRGCSPASDDRLADTAFAFYDPVPVTKPVTRPPQQRTSFKPKSLTDVLHQRAIEAINWWLRNFHAECERFAHFEWPDWCVEPQEREDYN